MSWVTGLVFTTELSSIRISFYRYTVWLHRWKFDMYWSIDNYSFVLYFFLAKNSRNPLTPWCYGFLLTAYSYWIINSRLSRLSTKSFRYLYIFGLLKTLQGNLTPNVDRKIKVSRETLTWQLGLELMPGHGHCDCRIAEVLPTIHRPHNKRVCVSSICLHVFSINKNSIV